MQFVPQAGGPSMVESPCSSSSLVCAAWMSATSMTGSAEPAAGAAWCSAARSWAVRRSARERHHAAGHAVMRLHQLQRHDGALREAGQGRVRLQQAEALLRLLHIGGQRRQRAATRAGGFPRSRRAPRTTGGRRRRHRRARNLPGSAPPPWERRRAPPRPAAAGSGVPPTPCSRMNSWRTSMPGSGRNSIEGNWPSCCSCWRGRAAAPGNSGHCKMLGFAVQPGVRAAWRARPGRQAAWTFKATDYSSRPWARRNRPLSGIHPIRPLQQIPLAFQQ